LARPKAPPRSGVGLTPFAVGSAELLVQTGVDISGIDTTAA
jgi:hypothetical protein